MENLNEKLVDYDKWCESCKHFHDGETEDPCNECLTSPARYGSHKPEKWEAKE